MTNWIDRLQFIRETPSFVFNFTSALLAIVGLLAVFVSLNTQHILQKCRELFWQMKSLKATFDLGISDANMYDQIARDFYSAYVIYKSLLQRDTKTKAILNVTKTSIIAVLILWWITLGVLWIQPGTSTYPIVDLQWVTLVAFVVSVLMIWFLVHLWNLDDIPRIGHDLLTPEEITDMSKNDSFMVMACTVMGMTYYMGELYVTIPYIKHDITGENQLLFDNLAVRLEHVYLDLRDADGEVHESYVDLCHYDPEHWKQEMILGQDRYKFLWSGTAWFPLPAIPSKWGVFEVVSFRVVLGLSKEDSVIRVSYPSIHEDALLEQVTRSSISVEYKKS
jgi:hypothetical protein